MPVKMDKKAELIQKIEDGKQTLSFSALKSFAQSPQHFIRYKLGDKPQTDAMMLGKVLHCLVLEPESFDKKYFVLNDSEICAQIGGLKPRATKAYKEWVSGQQSKIQGREIVEMQDYDQAFKMRNSVYENEVMRRYVSKIKQTESKVEFNHMGFDFVGYIDGGDFDKDDCIIIDLKMVQTAEPRKVERVIFDELYFMQLEMYRIGLQQMHGIDMNESKCYILAVDRMCNVSVHKIHADLLKFGRQKFEYLIKRFNECTFKNKWHEGYEFYSELGGIFLIDRPAYSYK